MRLIALLLIFALCPGIYGLDHRGRAYTTDGTNYILDDGSSFRSRRDMIIAVNTALFREITGIQSSTLEAMYIAMDVNSNGALEWNEIERFQALLVKKYRYLTNETVLRPDEFIAQGGGDCDDWVCMTAGLFRFWGYEAYMASFGKTKRIRHAVCLVYVTNEPPGNYMYYELSQWNDIPAGKYVPIDYGNVGGLSAIDRRWKIATMEVPEKMYGKVY